ncbi:MAG: hypothetical protein JWM10_494, partial [Myxococcaceae bacterium]|nr:hypothetical protein [Myxococcaceae bacterium]
MLRPSPTDRRAPAAALALAALAGCSDAPPPHAATDAATSDLGRVDASPDASDDRPRSDAATPGDRRRLPPGATYYLPRGETWSVAQAPAGNLNAVFRDAGSGRGAFVAHLVGDYRFTAASGASVTVTVVDPSAFAFHNLDYFPTTAVSVAAGVAYVASVLRPEVVAVNVVDLAPAFVVPVGGWPVAVASIAGRGTLLAACRGEDALTVVDLATRRPVRSVWVGDEVSNVAVTPDGATAIALLPHDRQVVLLNTADWSERARVAVGRDPHHLAVRADGGSVFVAGRRTGLGAAVEAGDPAGADLAEINLATGAVVRTVHHVGTTIGGIALGADGRDLYVAALRNDPGAALISEFAPHFRHSVVRYDLSAGAPIREAAAADLTRSRRVAPPDGDAGVDDAGAAPDPLDARRAVGLHWIGARDGAVWVIAESSDMVLRLDAATLAERARFDAPGRPRAGAFAADGTVLVFGHQAQRLTAIGAATGARTSAPLGVDPRPAAVAAGAAYFTGTGMRADLGAGRVVAGDVWSCGTCHADGLTDGLAWSVGPTDAYRALTPALTLLEGAWPLGWQGAASDVASAAITLHGLVGLQRPAQDQVDALAAYLGSIAPPPAPTSLTDRDGAPSAEATRG